jgi:protein tyrosine/serine phosphatase
MGKSQAALRVGLLVSLLSLGGIAGGGCASSSSASRSAAGVANVHPVEPGVLVRGAQPDAAGFRSLRQNYGIRTVVNFNDDTAVTEAALVETLGMRYVALPSSAFRPDAANVLAFLRTMATAAADGPVYVHCQHGMDRTGYAVAAYRILMQNWDADRAMRELRSYQAFPHALLFPAIEPFVRGVYRDRETWRRQLPPPSVTPAPAVVVSRNADPS